MGKHKALTLIKWGVAILVTVTPLLFVTYLALSFDQSLLITPGLAIFLGLIAGHEVLVLFFDYDCRYQNSLLFYQTNKRDYIVSIVAVLSTFIIAILNQWIMQSYNMDRFIIGGFMNILIPVCIFWFAGSKSLRQKVLNLKRR